MCRTVRPNEQEKHPDFRLKKLKLKSSDIQDRTSGGLSAIAWKDKKKDVYMLSNHLPVEINFCEERKNALKRYRTPQ